MMKLSWCVVACLSLALNPLVAKNAIAQSDRLFMCDSISDSSQFESPSADNREIQLDSLGVTFNIPENYRTVLQRGNHVSVLEPNGYDYLQCLMENRVPERYSILSVEIYQDELLISEEQLQSETRPFIPQLHGTALVDGQEAFIYTADGLQNRIFVRVNYPDRSASIIVSTDVVEDNWMPHRQEILERIVSTLIFDR